MEANTVIEPSGEAVPAWRRYYAEHKAEVLAKQKEQRRWITYYERHRAEAKEKVRARYYLKQGREVPPVKEHKPKTPKPTEPEVERMAELLAELRELVPYVMKPICERGLKKAEGNLTDKSGLKSE